MRRLLFMVFLLLTTCGRTAPPPTPQPPVHYEAAQTHLIACHVFFWHWSPSVWKGCIDTPKGIRPAIGYYASSNPETAKKHVEQMIRGGIDVVSAEWNGSDFDRANFEGPYLAAIAASPLKFTLLYDSSIRLAPQGGPIDFDYPVRRDRFVADFRQFATDPHYFHHPSYLTIGGWPVVYLYIARAYTDSTPSADDIASTFSAVQQIARDAGFPGIYFVADSLYPKVDGSLYLDRKLLRSIGARGVTTFGPARWVPQDPNEQGHMAPYGAMLAGLNAQAARLFSDGQNGLIDIHPGIFSQFDERGLDGVMCGKRKLDGLAPIHLGSVNEWTTLLQTVGSTAAVAVGRSGATNAPERTAITFIYSFNEDHEGTGIEVTEERTPRYPYGFGTDLLDALKSWKERVEP